MSNYLITVTYDPRQKLWSVHRNGALMGMYSSERKARRNARMLEPQYVDQRALDEGQMEAGLWPS